jgi:hypothetical protein
MTNIGLPENPFLDPDEPPLSKAEILFRRKLDEQMVNYNLIFGNGYTVEDPVVRETLLQTDVADLIQGYSNAQLPAAIKRKISDMQAALRGRRRYNEFTYFTERRAIHDVNVQQSPRLKKLQEFMEEDVENLMSYPILAELLKQWKWASHLRMLERMSDSRQLEQGQIPLPDGSNIAEQELRHEWLFRRFWIRQLHQKYMAQDWGFDMNMENIKTLEKTGIEVVKLLEIEIARTAPNMFRGDQRDNELSYPEPFDWIGQTKQEIMDEVNRFLDLLSVWPSGTPITDDLSSMKDHWFEHNLYDRIDDIYPTLPVRAISVSMDKY